MAFLLSVRNGNIEKRIVGVKAIALFFHEKYTSKQNCATKHARSIGAIRILLTQTPGKDLSTDLLLNKAYSQTGQLHLNQFFFYQHVNFPFANLSGLIQNSVAGEKK